MDPAAICSNIIVESLKKTSKTVGRIHVGQTDKSVIKPRSALKPKPKINKCTTLYTVFFRVFDTTDIKHFLLINKARWSISYQKMQQIR